jgi:hypothetical protein
MVDQKMSFDGYGYRTQSRFGSWTKITVEGRTVSVTGPRVGVFPYRLWLAAQAVLLSLVPLALVATVVLWDWRYLALVPALLIVHWFVGVMGAAGLWEMANATAMSEGHPTHSFPVSAIKDVTIGPGWARNGLWLVILPYVAGINKLSEGLCVSFEAPGGDIAGDTVYAFHMRSEDDAQALAALLEGR